MAKIQNKKDLYLLIDNMFGFKFGALKHLDFLFVSYFGFRASGFNSSRKFFDRATVESLSPLTSRFGPPPVSGPTRRRQGYQSIRDLKQPRAYPSSAQPLSGYRQTLSLDLRML